MNRDTKLLTKRFILILPVVLLGPFSVPGSNSGQYVVFSPSAFLNSKLCYCNLKDVFLIIFFSLYFASLLYVKCF